MSFTGDPPLTANVTLTGAPLHGASTLNDGFGDYTSPLLTFVHPVLFCALNDLDIRGKLEAYTGIRERVAI